MNETEKARFNACLDLVQWLDARIAQQVEHQVEQRLVQEREYWRCNVSDLITKERERVNALLVDVVTDGVKKGLNLAFDRIEAKLSELDRRLAAPIMRRSDDDDDGQPPPSKH
jgi:hypothetical protein